MKKTIILLFSAIMLIACNSPKEVPFIEAHNYFVRNDAPLPAPEKISSQKEFDLYFGMAAFMGKDGQPTAIDFSKQFVLPVVLPVTDVKTEITPKQLLCQGDTLFYTYEVRLGDSISYSIQPLSIIVVDKLYDDKILCVKQ